MSPGPLRRRRPVSTPGERRLYNSRRWRRRAADLVAEFPVCQTCERRASSEAHHVERHHGHPEVFWSSPLLALCHPCHVEATAAERRREPLEVVDVTGAVVAWIS